MEEEVMFVCKHDGKNWYLMTNGRWAWSLDHDMVGCGPNWVEINEVPTDVLSQWLESQGGWQ